ncbi:transglycosylase domain-containing protein [Patescibacteria group bacterium]|nr:transglycosylase domain-containing protein [Patescibacteria group bacterium]
MPIPQLAMKSPQSWKQHKQKPKRRKKQSKIPKLRRPKKSTSKNRPALIKKLLKLFKNNSRFLIKLGLSVVLVGFVSVTLLFAYYAKDLPDPNKIIDRTVAQSTKIYDRTGEELLYEISGDQKRTLVDLDQIQDHTINATISIEDKNFYKHGGISIWGIIRGQIVPRLQGKPAQGGSTLTQQLVKNAILTNERKISRKIKEWILSYRIEQKFTKDEILKLYFNEIPYGSNVYGVEAASNYYFGKHSSELVIAESAILAALPQAPSFYSPYGSNKDRLIGRQQYIIDLMVDQGYIQEDEALTAKEYELDFKNRITNITAPHFVLYIKEYLANKYGDQMIEQGGLKIITTLDLDAQTAAEEAISERVERNETNYNATNAALVAIDVQSGQIISMVGSRDYFDDEIDGQVNVTVQQRQPGSSFKPLVYLTGFTKGYTPESILFDLNTSFKAEPNAYEPKNYDLKEHGPVSVRKALAGSLNTPAVKMIYLAGVSNVLDLADSLGYSSFGDRSRFGLSLVLGGGEVQLLEHVNSFAAFSREGVWYPYSSILRVEDGDGRVLEEYHKPKGERVVDANYTRMLSDVLSDNPARAYAFGESNYLTLANRPVAAKTGTTDDYRDAWTVGYTPYQVAAGVWVGNNDNSEMKLGAAGGVVAAPIWQAFLNKYLANKEIKSFTKPSIINSDKPMIGGFMEGGDSISIDKFSGKLATEFTPDEAIIEKKFLEVHNILHYVERGDPTGPSPLNPEDNYQYENWEEPVIKWATEQDIIAEKAPTDFDNVHLPQDKPSINITSPSHNYKVTNGQLSITVNAGAPRGARKVTYLLDNKIIGEISVQPFTFTYTIYPNIQNGEHTLTAKVYDDLLNNNEDSIILIFDREEYIKSSWVSPSSGITLDSFDFPYSLSLSVDNFEILRQVDFYYKLDSSNQSSWLGAVKNINNKLITLTWANKPEIGIYKAYPVFTDIYNQVVQGDNITINIE